MFEGILAAAEEVASTPGVRAVILHGEGPSFCSGLDVASLMNPESPVSIDDILERGGHRANIAQRVATDWIDLPMPVIAALHGNVFGGGLQLALGADFRIAAPGATLSVMESRWGLVPDMGITSTLPRLVRIDVAKELTYTARKLSGDRGGRARPRHAHRRRPAPGRARARRRDRRQVARRDPRGQEALRRDLERPGRGGPAPRDRAAAQPARLEEPDGGGDGRLHEGARRVRGPARRSAPSRR